MIEGLRYGSNPLLEMRIQDILLEVDLSRHDPNHPDDPPPGEEPENDMKYDGTFQTADTGFKSTVEQYSNSIPLALEMDWAGPWPMLYFICDYAFSPTFSIIFEFSIDILFDFVVNAFYFGIADDPSIPMGEIEQAAQDAAAKCLELSRTEEQIFWGVAVTTLWGILGVMALAKVTSPWLEALFLALCAFWYISFVNLLAATVRLVSELSPLACVLTLARIALLVLFGTGIAWATGGSTAWQSFNLVFDEAVVSKAITGQEYRDAFKWRVSLYLVVIQVSALVVLAFVCFGIWTGMLG